MKNKYINIKFLIIITLFLFTILEATISSTDKLPSIQYKKTNKNIYAIPLSGKEDKDWFIANYIDTNKHKNSFKDFNKGFMTYDGHYGIDFTLSNFETMAKGISIKVSRSGTIESIHDGEFDYQTKRSNSKWNYIKIRHPDKSYAYYGHLKTGSILLNH